MEQPASTTRRHIPVDTEHFSVRFLVPVVGFGAAVIAYLITLVLVNRLDESLNGACLGLPVAFVVWLAAMFLTERVLKRTMPSRRSATLSEDSLVMEDRRRRPPDIREVNWHAAIHVMAWRFAIKRRTRVPKGWYCLALHLLQDEVSVILYTFMSPDDAKKLPGYDNFVRLRPRKETLSSADLSASAEQRRLLKLEDARWNDGAEIGPDDFRAVVAMIERYVPGWSEA